MELGITLNVFYEAIENLDVRGEPVDTSQEDLDPEKQLQQIKRLGIPCIEIQGPLHHVSSRQVSSLRARLASLEVRAHSLHAPFPVFNEKEIDDISSPDEDIRKSSIDLLKKAILTCVPLEPRILVLHPTGARTGEGSGLDKDAPAKRTRLERCKQSLRVLGKFCDSHGIRIALENELPGDVGEKISDLVELVNETDCANVGLCLDTGHACISGQDPPAMVELCGQKLFHIHVHDNNGEEDQHLFPFSGKIDWKKFVAMLHRIGYRGTFQMEVSASKALADHGDFLRIRSLASE